MKIKKIKKMGSDVDMKDNEALAIIGDPEVSPGERLEALKVVREMIDAGRVTPDSTGEWVNNHIHTCYSFSPYTPSSAVYYAWKAGLKTAGIMDHDSVGGMKEFIQAGKIIGMPITCGFECRVSVAGSPFEGKKLNNPDQNTCAYVAMHGVPHQNIEKAEEKLSVLRQRRNERNRRMCRNITDLISFTGMDLDFDRDVYPISKADEGGSVTERHVLFALTRKITALCPDRAEACDFIEKLIGQSLGSKREKLLTAPDNFYEYDILGILKSSLVEKIYVDADAELMTIDEFTAFAKELGAISAYAYLGDVGESPTGDKKAQKFEDDYLDELFEYLKKIGFNAITYMPSRNTAEQLQRVIDKCNELGFFQISGEDINSPRQSFICKALADPRYYHLRTSTYALIGHEIAASEDLSDSMFSDKTNSQFPSLGERTEHFSAIGGLHK